MITSTLFVGFVAGVWAGVVRSLRPVVVGLVVGFVGRPILLVVPPFSVVEGFPGVRFLLEAGSSAAVNALVGSVVGAGLVGGFGEVAAGLRWLRRRITGCAGVEP